MNKVFFTGRLTKSPILSETPSGIPVCTFTLAVNRPYPAKDGVRETDFFRIATFRTLAENCNKYLAKGSLCFVEGSLQNKTVEDKKGNKTTYTEIVCNNVEFLEKLQKTAQNENDGLKEAQPIKKVEQVSQLELYEDEDGLPF